MARLMRERILPRAEPWVAEEDGRVIAYATLEGSHLDSLDVLPEWQGRGVGAALLERAKALRPDGLELWVFQRSEEARRFYERHGFRLVRLTDGAANMERAPDALYRWAPEG